MYSNVGAEIVEQPKSMRFRYISEGDTAGSILGVNSTADNKTYPGIRIHNYIGKITVCLSCVTIDEPPRSHPNRLTGRGTQGVCSFDHIVTAESPTITFPNLKIQRPIKSDVVANLEERMKLNIDPFKTGYGHMENPKLINLQRIRLCFQVFLRPNPLDLKKLISLPPVISEIISDKDRTNVKLRICEKSDISSPPCGDKKILILCSKVDKRDIRIRFYEKGADDSVVWHSFATFEPKNVHKQVGISFKTPPYRYQNITEPVNVFFNLESISDGTYSDPVPFQYVPDFEVMILKKIDDCQTLNELLEIIDAENLQDSKMFDVDANVANAENIPPEIFQFGVSNYNPLPTNCEQLQYHNQQHENVYGVNNICNSSRQGQMGPIYAAGQSHQFCNFVHKPQSVMNVAMNVPMNVAMNVPKNDITNFNI